MTTFPIINQADPIDRLVKVTKATGDPLRARVLQALAEDAFGVLELCELFDMAQPAMSHHLKILLEAGLVTRRKEGTTVFYQRTVIAGESFITTIYDELDDKPISTRLLEKLACIHDRRSQKSRDFFSNNADALAQQRELICAPEVYHDTVLQIIKQSHPLRRGHALEVGPGNGALLKALEGHFDQVTGMDSSAAVLADTAMRLGAKTQVQLVEMDFLKAPHSRRYDLIVAAMVVHHLPSPARFFIQARKLLKRQGIIVLVELCPHNQTWVQEACGDLWQGFSEEQINRWADRADLEIKDQHFLAQRNGFRVQVVSMSAPPNPQTFVEEKQ